MNTNAARIFTRRCPEWRQIPAQNASLPTRTARTRPFLHSNTHQARSAQRTCTRLHTTAAHPRRRGEWRTATDAASRTLPSEKSKSRARSGLMPRQSGVPLFRPPPRGYQTLATPHTRTRLPSLSISNPMPMPALVCSVVKGELNAAISLHPSTPRGTL